MTCGKGLRCSAATVIVLLSACLSAQTGTKSTAPRVKPAPAPTRVEYVLEDKEGALFNVLRAKVNGKTRELIDRSDGMRLAIVALKDFDGNGQIDALVSGWMGNCCPNTLIMVSAFPGGRFELAEDFANTWGEPVIQKWKDRWSVFVTSSNEGYNQERPERIDRRFVFEKGKAVMVEEIKHQNMESILEMRSEQFDSRGDGLTDTLEFDLDGDGRRDKIIAVYWSRWGRMRCSVQFADGKEVEDVGSCKRIGVLATKTKGVNDLVCDQDIVVHWNGKTYE